jgi:hypothetical protein
MTRWRRAIAVSDHGALRAGEAAQIIVQFVGDCQAFPDEAACDLRRLLANSLSDASPGERRVARLGLLIDLAVGDGKPTGEWISVEDYEIARARRAKAGESWPSSSALSEAFGGWLRAVGTAMRFYMGGGKARVPASLTDARPHARYEPREILSGLIRFRNELGVWPTEWEWTEYAPVRTRHARRAGVELRLASPKQIRKAYGTFDRAVRAAAAVYGSSGG